MAGLQHAEAALLRALRAVSRGSRVARSLEMEALLYASASRQCAVGAGFGIQEGCNRAFVAIVPPKEEARRALSRIMGFVHEDWEGIDPGKKRVLMDLFAITDRELEAAGEGRIRALVLERVALLEVNK
jgi:KEOPS complex subunit Cgi121